MAVTALVGAEMLGRLRGEPVRRYHCCCCGQPGRVGAEPAAVIVQWSKLGVLRVRFAHARCAGSQVVDVDADSFDLTAAGAMLAKAAVLEHASARRIRPVLVLEPRVEMSERTGPARR